MKMRVFFIAGTGLIALAGIAKADDHLFQAVQAGGLDPAVSQPFQGNPSGFNPEEANGQGSPFTSFLGGETGIPATAQPQAHHDQKQPPAANK